MVPRAAARHVSRSVSARTRLTVTLKPSPSPPGLRTVSAGCKSGTGRCPTSLRTIAPTWHQTRTLSSTVARSVTPRNNVSEAHGPLEPALLEQSLGEFWDSLVQKQPDCLALVSRHEGTDQHSLNSTPGHKVGQGEGECLRWTFRDMHEHVEAMARGLIKLGVKKGDRVGVFLGNDSTYAMLQWGLAKIGAILVCINPASSLHELRSALNLTGCDLLFISRTIKNRDLVALLHDMLPSLRSTSCTDSMKDEQCPALKKVFMVDNTDLGAKGFADLLDRDGLAGRDSRNVLDWSRNGVPDAPACTASDVINFQFTSGTTGLPKAVALTHHNVLNNGRFIGQCMHLKEPAANGEKGEVLINAPPNFHCFGLVLGNLALWTHGGCVVFPNESFDPALTLRAAHAERATAIHGVPTMFLAELALLSALESGATVPNLSDLGQSLDFSSLRTGIAAGSPVPDDVMRRLINRLNLTDLTITYGMTETSPATVMSRASDPTDKKIETIGRVLPHTKVKIVSPSHPKYPDPDTPAVPVGERGELWSGGYAVMAGYWENDHETSKACFVDADGTKWMRTGDQATMDEQGYIKITGRIKDLIIRGGENLSPVLIEARSLMCPGVQDCSIIAVPDPVMGEVPGAFVQRANNDDGRRLTGQKLRAHVTELLGHQHAPDWVWFLGEDGIEAAYPVTQSGKIRKVELRNWAEPLVASKIGSMRVKQT